MYRKFLRKSKRITAITLASAMIFGSMTAYAAEEKPEEVITATEVSKAHFTDRIAYEGESLIRDHDVNMMPAAIKFGNAGTEAINLADYEFKVRGIENCEDVKLELEIRTSGVIESGQEAEYSYDGVDIYGFFPENYTKSYAKFVVDVYDKKDLNTVVYTTKEACIFPYKIVETNEGSVLKYNDPSRDSKYEVKVETDEHCRFDGLVGGSGGDSTEIWEDGADGKPICRIFSHSGYPSSYMMTYDNGYVFGTAKLEPEDAGTVKMAAGSGCIYVVDVHKPATLKVTSATETVLEGEHGMKFVADGNAENAGEFSGLEMKVKICEDNFDWLKHNYGAGGEILAYESTVKIQDSLLAPDVKCSIKGNVPRIYIPIPEGWNKEKIGVFCDDPEMYSYTVNAAEVSKDGKYVIVYPKGFEKEFTNVTVKLGIFEKVDPTVAKDWETVAFRYIETMRFVNWGANVTFDQHFFEKTATPNDVAYMTYRMEMEKYVENYRVGETYKLEIPYDVLAKDATKYYKNIPDLKKMHTTFLYYDAAKNAFITPEGGVGDAPPVATVKKVDELGNKTYAIRFEFKDNIETPKYESEATLVVEDNGQGNWRYISFLKGYPEIAPIEPEKPTEPTPDKPSTNNPIVNPNPGEELSQAVVDKVVEKVENAEKGSEVVVKMQGATVVPSEVLESVKGKDVNVVLDMGEYSWTINGKDVTADKLQDINLEVTINSKAIPQNVVDKTADGNPAIQLSLTHNGEFGFKADLKINVGAKYKGMTAKLYYYNKDGKLEYVQSNKVEADGTVTFNFGHASDYVVVLTDAKTEVENTTPNTGDSSPVIMNVFMMLLAGGLVVFVGRRKLCK